VQEKKIAEAAAVATITPNTPAPVRQTPVSKGPGLLARFLSLFSAGDDDSEQQEKRRSASGKKRDGRGGQRSRRRSEPQRTDQRAARSSKTARKRGGKGAQDEAARTGAGSSDASATSGNAPAARAHAESRKDARDETRRPPGKRRSRGGRRRKRSDGGDAAEAGDSQQRSETAVQDSANERPGRESSSSRRRSGRSRGERTAEPATGGEAAERTVESFASSSLPAAAVTAPRETNDAGLPAVPAARPASAEPRREQAKRDDWSSSYDDTQPELPIIRSPENRFPDIGAAIEPAASPSRAIHAAEPQSPRDVQQTVPAGDAPARSAEQPREIGSPPVAEPGIRPELLAPKSNGGGPDAGKPAGRLLPWEPAKPLTPETQGIDKIAEKADRSEPEGS
jgi:hypothetical protein